MKDADAINKLLESLARGERHIVKVKVDSTLQGPLAIQYKLLRLLKNEDFDETSFVQMLLIGGLLDVSKTVLKELLSVKGITSGMWKKLFGE